MISNGKSRNSGYFYSQHLAMTGALDILLTYRGNFRNSGYKYCFLVAIRRTFDTLTDVAMTGSLDTRTGLQWQ